MIYYYLYKANILKIIITEYHFASFEASYFLFAKVSATKMGKTKVASENILTYWPFILNFDQVKAYEALAPESLPSS